MSKENKLDQHSTTCCRNCGCFYDTDSICSVKHGWTIQLTKCGKTKVCNKYDHYIDKYDDWEQ